MLRWCVFDVIVVVLCCCLYATRAEAVEDS